MYDNYDDACEAVISKKRARMFVITHCIFNDDACTQHESFSSDCETWQRFVKEVGDQDEYIGGEVLDWLGY